MNRYFKINLLLLISILLTGCFFSCAQNKNGAIKAKTNVAGQTSIGYPYVLHTSNGGPKVKIGDQVEYHEIIFKNDSLVRSTFLTLEPMKAIMPTRDKVANPPPPSYEALFEMSVGDSLSVYHLLDTFKNYQRPGWLKKDDTLIYNLKLLSITPKAEIDAKMDAIKKRQQTVGDSIKNYIAAYKGGSLIKDLQTTKGGVRYLLHKPGTGKQAESGKYVKVHYSGFLMDGTSFDNSFEKTQTFPFKVGKKGVIPGWNDAIPILKEGGSATLFIPSALAYGEEGKKGKDENTPGIPPNADLVFYVEVVEVF